MDCPICFNEINASTGRSTLGCGHEFHLRCIVEWFNNQEAACSCPCCRREQGEFDTVPIYPEEEVEGEYEEEIEEEEEDEEEEALGSPVITGAFANLFNAFSARREEPVIDNVWRRQPNGRWVRLRIVREAPVTWSPADGTEPPAELKKLADDGATRIQSIWRGFATRKEQTTAAIKGAATLLMALGISVE
jgi:hypothetical protein